MLGTPLLILLELPPLAFGPVLPAAPQMPRELLCAVEDLAHAPAIKPVRIPNLPRFAAPGAGRRYLFGPKTDFLITLVGVFAAGATGGSVDLRPPEQKIREATLPILTQGDLVPGLHPN